MSGISGTISVNKSALAQQFSAAAESYDVWAKAQAEIAARLMRHIPAELSPSLIVDLGCGTGLLSAHLLDRYPAASLVGIDLASGMVNHCCNSFPAGSFYADPPAAANPGTQSRARFLVGDVEDRASLVPHAELVASSCVAQWFADMPATVCMWAKSLAPGGSIAFACLLQGSFCELEQAYYEALERSFCGLSLPTSEALPRLFRTCGLRPTVCVEDTVSTRYAGARLALRSFQQIGAVFQGQPGHLALGPSALRRLIESYDRHADAEGMVSVTYRVQYIVAERSR
jgi:malonyl-ACP O-methyltransferase BioC